MHDAKPVGKTGSAIALHRIHPTPFSVWVPCGDFDGSNTCLIRLARFQLKRDAASINNRFYEQLDRLGMTKPHFVDALVIQLTSLCSDGMPDPAAAE